MTKQQTLPFAPKVDMFEDKGAQTESADDTTTPKVLHPLKRQKRRAPPKKEPVMCINDDSDMEGGK